MSSRYPHGEYALVKIETEGPEWLEWCGAMYESYASDHDPESTLSYCKAAHRLAEEIEQEVYETIAERHYDAPADCPAPFDHHLDDHWCNRSGDMV
jgi:hypothetical protein